MTAVHDRSFLLGCHLSIAKGISRAIDDAETLGNTALQIFTHPPAAWRMKPQDEREVERFRERRASSAIRYLVVHTMYLLNLGSADEVLHRRSTDALIEEIRRAGALGAEAVVTHVGAHGGSGVEQGVERVAAALQRTTASPVWDEDGPRLLLENTAGAGTTLGATFEELAAVLVAVGDPRVGLCLDSCHAFAAGYDLRTRAALDATLAQLDRITGERCVEMIHLNDAKFALGSRRDRHAHIGRGEIGSAGIGEIVRHPGLRDLPFVLETPKQLDGRADADRINLAAVRRLRSWKESPV